jgi:hypothetical protein
MNLKDKRGVQRTESLFHETIQPPIRKKYDPVYSLRDYDHKGYPSAYQIYMNSIDEHEAALKLVGSLSHWRKLTSLKWFLEGRPECQFEGLIQWREDMKARDASSAKQVLQEQVKEKNITAARALLAESKTKTATAAKAKSSAAPADSNVADFLAKYKENK